MRRNHCCVAAPGSLVACPEPSDAGSCSFEICPRALCAPKARSEVGPVVARLISVVEYFLEPRVSKPPTTIASSLDPFAGSEKPDHREHDELRQSADAKPMRSPVVADQATSISERAATSWANPVSPIERGKVPTRVLDLKADLLSRHIPAMLPLESASLDPNEVNAPGTCSRPFTKLICGARGKRTGRPCPQKGLYPNGRCRWHGGLSTGPRTPEGKARSMLNHLTPKRTGSEPREGDEVEPVLPCQQQPQRRRERRTQTSPYVFYEAASARTKINGVLRHICEYMEARPDRWHVASGIAAALSVPAGVVEAALRFLIVAGRVERLGDKPVRVRYRWRASTDVRAGSIYHLAA